MAGRDQPVTGGAAIPIAPHDLLLRAALLSRLGPDAQVVADRLAGLLGPAAGRSCLEAGSPIQLTIDGPGPAGLRAGIRTSGSIQADELDGLVPATTAGHLADVASRLPPATYASIGSWVFWSRSAVSLYVDLRDPDEDRALDRAAAMLRPDWAARMSARGPGAAFARPWALRVTVGESGPTKAHMLWLLRSGVDVAATAERLVPGAWATARRVLGGLVRRPGASGRFVVTTPLDDASAPGLRIGSTGWALVPEDRAKQRALSRLVASLGGPGDHAEALWSLVRGVATAGWCVGRACEVRVTEEGPRVRVFLTPEVAPVGAHLTRPGPSTDPPTARQEHPTAARR